MEKNHQRPESTINRDSRDQLIEELKLHQIELKSQYEELEIRKNQVERVGNKYRRLYNNAPVGFLTLSHLGDIINLNERAVSLLQKPKERLIGTRFQLYLSMNSRRTFHEFGQIIKKNVDEVSQCEVELILGNEEKRIIHLEGYAFRPDRKSEKKMYISTMDVTQKKEYEKMMENTTRLESLGLLAGGIAHDFNNILSVLLGAISISRMSLNDNESLEENFVLMESAIERAKSLTAQLLTFSKGGTPIKEKCDIGEITEKAIRFALSGSKLKSEILMVQKNLWAVMVDRNQINQVLLNIIGNARQATEEGGKIKVELQNVHIEEKENLNFDSQTHQVGKPIDEGDYVKISITDQGIGIPNDIADKVFDPYFSTKSSGEGLGLAVASSIITKHSGKITFNANQEKGTTFHIFLPAIKEISNNNKQKNDSVSKMKKFDFSGHSALIIDDQQEIGHVTRKMLEKYGFFAISTLTGKKGIELYRDSMEKDEKFDVVFVDLTLPGGMGGKQIIKQLKEIDPDINAIVLSGYSESSVLNNYESYGFKARLKKPYTVDKLKEVLDSIFNL